MIRKPPLAFAGHKGAWADYIMRKAHELEKYAPLLPNGEPEIKAGQCL